MAPKSEKRVGSRRNIVIAALLFAILAIASSGGVLAGQLRLLSRAETIVGGVVRVFDETTGRVYNTTEALREVTSNLSTIRHADPKLLAFLANIPKPETVDSLVAHVQRKVEKINVLINKGLNIAQLVTILIICVNLLALTCVSVFGVLRLRRLLRAVLVLGWFLAVLWCVFFSIYVAADKLEGYTCKTLQDFNQDPNNSSLSRYLPRKQLLAADSNLHQLSKGIHDLLNTANAHLSQSLGNTYQICNPFSDPPEHNYQPEKCHKNTMTLGRAAQILRMISCPDSTDGSCLGGIYVDHDVFYNTVGYLKALDSLLRVYPDINNLVKFQPIKDAVSEIVNNHCQPLKKDTRIVWASLLLLGITTMLVLLIWKVEGHQEEEEDAAEKPYITELDLMEAGLREDQHKEQIKS